VTDMFSQTELPVVQKYFTNSRRGIGTGPCSSVGNIPRNLVQTLVSKQFALVGLSLGTSDLATV